MIKNTLIVGGWWVLVVHLYQRVLLSIEKEDFGALDLDVRAMVFASVVAVVVSILVFREVLLSTVRRPRRLIGATVSSGNPQPGRV